MKKQQKIKIVEELKEKLAKAKSLVLTDYRGLTHQQLEQIKKGLKTVGAEFLVTKNTLLKISLTGNIPTKLNDFLTGPTAVLLSYEDEIAPLSPLSKFIKNFGLPKIKIGIIGDKDYTAEEILKLAALPSKEILQATLVTRLKSPIYGLHYALNYNLTKLAFVLKNIKK